MYSASCVNETSECENLQKQIVLLKSTIQEKEVEIEGFKEDIAKLKSNDECVQERLNAMEAKEADLEMELNQIKTRSVIYGCALKLNLQYLIVS